MTRDRLGKLAALAQGAALVGLGACSNNETPVQAPSAPVSSAASATDSVDAGVPDDGGNEGPTLGDGGRGWWRRHGVPNALPPRLQQKPTNDAGP